MNNLTIEREVKKHSEVLKSFDTVLKKYEYLIELGSKTSELSEDQRTEDSKLSGCNANCWIKIEGETERSISSYSSSATALGILGIITEIFNGRTKEEIRNNHIDVLHTLGISNILTPVRHNDCTLLIRQIYDYCV